MQRAFVDCPHSKAELLNSLEAHTKADHIIQGNYLDLDPNDEGEHTIFAGACALGCALVDFIPPDKLPLHQINRPEDWHLLFQERFAIPAFIAEAIDIVHESLSLEQAKTWPIRVISAIHTGAELDNVCSRVDSACDRIKGTVGHHTVLSEADAKAVAEKIIDILKGCKPNKGEIA